VERGNLARAGTYTWDASGVGPPSDGGGTWSLAASNWWSGSADVAWPNYGADPNPFDSALFGSGGQGGAIAMNSTINVDTITFGTTSGGGCTLNATNGMTLNVATTLGTLGGSGTLTATGTGTLNLSAAAAGGFAGTVAIAAGKIGTYTAGALSGGSLELTSGAWTVGTANLLNNTTVYVDPGATLTPGIAIARPAAP